MDRNLIFQDKISIYHSARDQVQKIELETPDEGLAAEFPVQSSLLIAVTNGFTYQVANREGSLNIVRAEQHVVWTFMLAGGAKHLAKMTLPNFDAFVDTLPIG